MMKIYIAILTLLLEIVPAKTKTVYKYPSRHQPVCYMIPKNISGTKCVLTDTGNSSRWQFHKIIDKERNSPGIAEAEKRGLEHDTHKNTIPMEHQRICQSRP
jgi:hypothetical protein